MKRVRFFHQRRYFLQGLQFAFALLFLAACVPVPTIETVTAITTPATITPTVETSLTPLPTRETYLPGTLVAYEVQDGDTLPALAAHFNTTEKEIREANPSLPEMVTTLPPGMPMKIPIYYKALWGNPYQILPNSLFVDGPAQVEFDTVAYVNSQPGWLKHYSALAGGSTYIGGDLINYLATEYSISPRLLLAIIEYQTGALSQPVQDPSLADYPLGYKDQFHKGLYLQLDWAANVLNNGYYEWLTGDFDAITRSDGTLEHPDPWQNAATVGLQYYFSLVLPVDQYSKAIYDNGLAATYRKLFGNPWLNVQPIIPGSLTQPTLTLPFAVGKAWAFTGAPHSGWGIGPPLAAMDFAPPASESGCVPTNEYDLAVANGEIVRTVGEGVVVLDLDGDGDERTGWNIFYMHVADDNVKVRVGTLVKTGDPIGHPSCTGGETTGTHVHIARKYNGQWMPADSAIPFVMDGWTPHNGAESYEGTLTKNGNTVTASDKAAPGSQISAGK
jgi:murein DD-endopeptidase MepM/ murein hydrolase activator NlpD